MNSKSENERLKKISERYGIELPEDEAGFIALHLVNAQTEKTMIKAIFMN